MKLTEHNQMVIEKFAEMIITRIEQMGASDWKKGWIGRTLGGNPVNIEGKGYQGSNNLWLMLACSIFDWKYPIYCTLRQANRLGARINKGSRALPVIFWDLSVTAPNGQHIKSSIYLQMNKTEQKTYKVFPFLKSYSVFNIEQTNLADTQPDKIEELKSLFGTEPSTDTDGMYCNEALDAIIDRQGWLCPIKANIGSNRAYYSPSEDVVVVPDKWQFKIGKTDEEVYKDGQEYYASLLHEMVHSTSTPDRLNRQTGKKFGDDLYAREELVAELSAARIGQVLGFDKRILDNNAAYCKSWCLALRQNPQYVLSLMTDVEKASRMVFDKL